MAYCRRRRRGTGDRCSVVGVRFASPDHRSPMTDHRINSPQARRRSGSPAFHAVRPPAKRPHAAKDPPATLASIKNLAVAPEVSKRGCFGRMAGLCSEQTCQPPEDRSVRHARSSRREGPGMSGLMPQRVVLLAFRQVGRDRDAVRRAILDLAAGQFARGKSELSVQDHFRQDIGVAARKDRKNGLKSLAFVGTLSMGEIAAAFHHPIRHALSFCAHDRDAQGGRIGVVAAARAIRQGNQRIRVEAAAAKRADHDLVGFAGRGR